VAETMKDAAEKVVGAARG